MTSNSESQGFLEEMIHGILMEEGSPLRSFNPTPEEVKVLVKMMIRGVDVEEFFESDEFKSELTKGLQSAYYESSNQRFEHQKKFVHNLMADSNITIPDALKVCKLMKESSSQAVIRYDEFERLINDGVVVNESNIKDMLIDQIALGLAESSVSEITSIIAGLNPDSEEGDSE